MNDKNKKSKNKKKYPVIRDDKKVITKLEYNKPLQLIDKDTGKVKYTISNLTRDNAHELVLIHSSIMKKLDKIAKRDKLSIEEKEKFLVGDILAEMSIDELKDICMGVMGDE